MGCPGLHCPGCPGGNAIALGPVTGLAIGTYLALHSPTVTHAITTVLVCVLVGEGLAIVGVLAVLVLVFRGNRPGPREVPPAAYRAEPIGREPVYVVTTAPERGALAAPAALAGAPRPWAHEPARARVLRGRGAGTGPGR